MQDLERAIRERAYQLWTETGYQDGHSEIHWLAAQREILSASLGELGRVTLSEPSAKQKKPKAPRRRQRAA
jgi:hypothetical protein